MRAVYWSQASKPGLLEGGGGLFQKDDPLKVTCVSKLRGFMSHVYTKTLGTLTGIDRDEPFSSGDCFFQVFPVPVPGQKSKNVTGDLRNLWELEMCLSCSLARHSQAKHILESHLPEETV